MITEPPSRPSGQQQVQILRDSIIAQIFLDEPKLMSLHLVLEHDIGSSLQHNSTILLVIVDLQPLLKDSSVGRNQLLVLDLFLKYCHAKIEHKACDCR